MYRGGWHKKHITKQEIEDMKKNMKKVPVISLKSDIYHEREEQEAEHILEKIPHTEDKQEYVSENKNYIKNNTWLITKIKSLRQHFISLF